MVLSVERHHGQVRFTSARDSPEGCTFLRNLLLPIFGVVDIDGACPHGQVEGIFVEQDSAARMVGDVENGSWGNRAGGTRLPPLTR